MADSDAFEFNDLVLPSEEEDVDDWDDEDVEAMQPELTGDGEKIGDLACRDKKALSDRKRKDKFKLDRAVVVPVPRELVTLRALNFEDLLVPEVTEVPSREACRVLMAEYSESVGAAFKISGRSKHPLSDVVPGCDLFFMQGVCLSEACPFTFRFTAQEKPAQPWQLASFEPHIHGCGSPTRRSRRTCYNLCDLARLVVRWMRAVEASGGALVRTRLSAAPSNS